MWKIWIKKSSIPSRKGTSNTSAINNDLDKLTRAQKYSILSHKAANDAASNSTANTNSKTNSSTLSSGRKPKTIVFCIQNPNGGGGPPGTIRQPIQFSGQRDNICPIKFNGKTDIVKLGIALKDDNGYLVDLHGGGIIITWNTSKFLDTPEFNN